MTRPIIAPRALLTALCLVLALTACAADFRPAGPPVAPPTLADTHWRAADGVSLPLRVWLPSGQPRAVILALHGMNDYSNAFERPGRVLASLGIAVYAYDQRGFGRAPDPGYWPGTAALTGDLAAIARLIAAAHPGIPFYVLGESMGGAVAMVAAADQMLPPQTAGLILSAPAVWDRDRMTLVERVSLWLAFQIAPGWRLTGSGLDVHPSDNIAMLRRLSLDPLVIKATRVDAIEGLVDLMDRAARAAPRLTLPVLALYGAHDDIIPADAFWAMAKRLDADSHPDRVTIGYYAQGYHLLLRDLHAGLVLNDIAAWTEAAGRPLPSGADQRARKAERGE
jgi:acylglycerol lipase